MNRTLVSLVTLALITASCMGQKVTENRQMPIQKNTAIHGNAQYNRPHYIKKEAKVMCGIDILQENDFKQIENKRIGLITNATGVDMKMRTTIDILYHSKNVDLKVLFAPEHGVRGEVWAGDKVASSTDSRTGLPIHSLYGKTRKPTQEMLQGLDALVYDIQDIGCRSYTFVSTLYLAMEAAADAGVEFYVLDRPNPLGGEKVEGCLVESSFTSFVSQIPVPYIYGLTVGELANYINGELMQGKNLKLNIVKMRGWQRHMTWKETDNDWILASPHIPSAEVAQYYPMTGILGELGIVSIGVGYTLPFQTVAAPWIDGNILADCLTKKNLRGVAFRPVTYKPFYSLFAGEVCHGVQIHITNWQLLSVTEVQFVIMEVLGDLYPDKFSFALASKDRTQMFDRVCGTNKIRLKMGNTMQWNNAQLVWTNGVDNWENTAKKYMLY